MPLNRNHTDGGRLAMPTGIEVASYSTYLEAQRAVDHLSDHDLPVDRVSIVGTDLRMVEKVLGRMTYGRVAAAGALNGAWFGALIGAVLMLMSGATFGIMLAAILMGAAFGILAGIVGFALRSRDRDFTSTSQVVASRYAIITDPEVSQQVGRELDQAGLGGRAREGGRGSAPQGQPQHHGGVQSHGGVQRPVDGQRPAESQRPVEPPRYGIRLEPGQSIDDVTGRRDAPTQQGEPRGPRDQY